MKADQIPYHICRSATNLFLEKGFESITMSDVATAAELPEADLYTYFGSKHDIVLFLYASINADWQLSVNGLAGKSLPKRFEAAMIAKVDLMMPYLDVLSQMTGMLLTDPKISVRSPRTSHIRSMGYQVMQTLVSGSSHNSSLKKSLTKMTPVLYMAHWAILFFLIQTRDAEKTRTAILVVSRLLKQTNHLHFFLQLLPLYREINTLAASLLEVKGQVNHSIDREILKVIFNNRKTSNSEKKCSDHTCETCYELHENKVHFFTAQNKPIHFILPAFPAKSPNRDKVLGGLPDLAEEIALKNLEDICKEIKNVYAPGAYITICSDGRIFSDLVGVTDADVTKYVSSIKEIIKRLKLQHIDIVNLEDLLNEDGRFEAMRTKVLSKYAEPLDILQERLKSGGEFKDLFNGIHRFISDDRKVLYPEASTNAIKNESKDIALKVIQHSNAWTRFLTYIFPEAIRLSIHPYPAHSLKIGIRLTKATDNWLTPWHGVIVLQRDGYLLMKKKQAESLGAKLVLENGVPFYYTLMEETK